MELIQVFTDLSSFLEIFTVNEWISSYAIGLEQHQQAVLWLMVLFLFIIGTTIYMFSKKFKTKAFLPKVKEFVGVESTQPRFRKRDKVLFYSRKMLRKVKSISGQVHGAQGKKRKLVMKIARKLLRLKKDPTPQQLKVLEPPVEYLQEDVSKDDGKVPPDAFYMLQSIRVFGHFDKPIFLKLCKHTEILNLPAGAYLFKIGDADENVYVVQSGRVNLYLRNDSDGSLIMLKAVKTGDSVTSLLSFTDVLTGHPKPYKTMTARAVEDSTVVRLPMAAFHEVFQEHPDTFIRVIQVIMVRLQRVVFTALHQHLGLSAELVNPGTTRKKNPFSQSPVKSKSKDFFTKDEFVNSQDGLPMSPMDPPSNGGSMTSSFTSATTQPAPIINQHRRSRSGMEIRFSAQQPDIMPEFNLQNQSSPQTTPDVQAGTGNNQTKRNKHLSENYDEETLINMATEAFTQELGLDDVNILRGGKVEIREVPSGTYLMKEDSHKDVALIYVMTGTLIVTQKTTGMEEEVHMFSAHPGEIVGGLAVLTGEPSIFTVRAKHFSRIALLSKNTVYSILCDRPHSVLQIAHTVVSRLSPFVRQVDFALDWVFLESGRAVYRQGDESDSTFIVLSGRLRSVITHDNGKRELVGEYGKGDLVGIVEMVTQTSRSTTVMAVRDSELAKLPKGLFNAITLRYPIVQLWLINLLGHRILGSWQKPSIGQSPAVDARPQQNNFSTIAIVPVSDDVPLTSFTYELYHSLCSIGTTIRLTSEVIRKTLGASIMDQSNEYRLTSWLAQQEDQHKIALYQCDNSNTTWTQRCVRQADCVLIVGLGDRPPSIGKIEKEVERMAMRTQKELILLHKEGGERPNNTLTWLNMRTWVSSHHHIQCSKRMFIRRSQFRINELYSKVLMSEPNVHSDFSRLARWLTGTSVGLVLGGGGARGASHIGMIKAIQEAGIPIDMVGGVSIGAFMGALWCSERNIVTVTQKAREWSKKMTHWWRQILDLTYPATSMFTGSYFNQTIYKTFGDTYIEDLWIPYFTLTTDITSSVMRTHTHADVMRSLGAKHIIAIDVGSQDDVDLTNYGDCLSGWWLLWKRYNPFSTPVRVPNLHDIQSRLAYVSCVRQLEEVKSSDYCEYIRPPIDKFKTLQFGSFDEIKDVGYNHGRTFFAGMLKGGGLPPFLKQPETIKVKSMQSPNAQQNVAAYTFTDLAQMVCKVQRGHYYGDETETSDDDYEADEEDTQEVGYASEPANFNTSSNKLLKRRAGGSLSYSENELESVSESEYVGKNKVYTS
uniref:Neuropathy target esterase sws n=1 Tax=Clastoptera arizonana TaxID=38151 RepID=A0A1B6E580_9HEMI